MQPAATDPAPPASEAPEPVPPPRLAAVDLTAGFLVALALVPVVVRVTQLESNGPVWGWIWASLAITIGLGVLLRVAGLRHGPGLAMAALATAAPVATVGVALFAMVPGTVVVGLLAGLLAVPFAAVVAAAWGRTMGAATAAVVCVMSLAVTGGWSSMAGDRLLDAQRDLARAGDLEASELEPFLPRVSGWKPSFGSTVRREGEPVGYSLSFEQEGASGSVVDRDRWSVDVELAGTGDPCPPSGPSTASARTPTR